MEQNEKYTHLRSAGGFGLGSINQQFYEFDPENILGFQDNVQVMSILFINLSKHPHPHDVVEAVIKALVLEPSSDFDSLLEEKSRQLQE